MYSMRYIEPAVQPKKLLVWSVGKGARELHTAISKSTILSVKVDISLSKQTLYSPISCAVKTKSPWRSFWFAMITLSPGPTTL